MNNGSTDNRTPESDTWRLWLDGKRPAAWNMALDEALLRTAPGRGRPVLRIYDWERPAISIGYMQTIAGVSDSDRDVVRRPTGGGVVYHGEDITYTVVVPAGHPLAGMDKYHLYNTVNVAVAAALREFDVPAELASTEIGPHVNRRTMVCFAHPTRYDVMAAGHKVAGSAQRRTPEGVLHQGSILAVGMGFTRFEQASRTEWTEALVRAFRRQFNIAFEPLQSDADLFALAETLVREKYADDAWTRRR